MKKNNKMKNKKVNALIFIGSLGKMIETEVFAEFEHFNEKFVVTRPCYGEGLFEKDYFTVTHVQTGCRVPIINAKQIDTVVDRAKLFLDKKGAESFLTTKAKAIKKLKSFGLIANER